MADREGNNLRDLPRVDFADEEEIVTIFRTNNDIYLDLMRTRLSREDFITSPRLRSLNRPNNTALYQQTPSELLPNSNLVTDDWYSNRFNSQALGLTRDDQRSYLRHSSDASNLSVTASSEVSSCPLSCILNENARSFVPRSQSGVSSSISPPGFRYQSQGRPRSILHLSSINNLEHILYPLHECGHLRFCTSSDTRYLRGSYQPPTRSRWSFARPASPLSADSAENVEIGEETPTSLCFLLSLVQIKNVSDNCADFSSLCGGSPCRNGGICHHCGKPSEDGAIFPPNSSSNKSTANHSNPSMTRDVGLRIWSDMPKNNGQTSDLLPRDSLYNDDELMILAIQRRSRGFFPNDEYEKKLYPQWSLAPKIERNKRYFVRYEKFSQITLVSNNTYLTQKPCNGSEVFVSNIPPDTSEAELIPFLEKAGYICLLRIVHDKPYLSNMLLAYATYFYPEAASYAIRKLNVCEFREGVYLHLKMSLNNNRLFVGKIPFDKTKDQLWQELRRSGIRNFMDITMYRSISDKTANRGFVFLEFANHFEAAKARNLLRETLLWGKLVYVDWSIPTPDMTNEYRDTVKILFLRNLSPLSRRSELIETIRLFIDPGSVEKVYRFKDFAYVHLTTRSVAEYLLDCLTYYYKNTIVEVQWSKPPSPETKPEYRMQEVARRCSRRYMQERCRSPLLKVSIFSYRMTTPPPHLPPLRHEETDSSSSTSELQITEL